MKKFILMVAAALSVWACTSTRQTSQPNGNETSVVVDSTEYEVRIMDNDFDRWYMMHFSPSQDRSNEFYRSKNNLAVSNWNQYFIRNRYSRAINNYISYNPATDYGIDVNRQLYWYFKYIEESFRVPLLR